jgi:beta-glucanase (GH16 family)
MLASKNLQEFTFVVWAAKIRLPYGQGMWLAWWLLGNQSFMILNIGIGGPWPGPPDYTTVWP